MWWWRQRPSLPLPTALLLGGSQLAAVAAVAVAAVAVAEAVAAVAVPLTAVAVVV